MEGQRDHEKHELNSIVIKQEMGTEALTGTAIARICGRLIRKHLPNSMVD